MSVFTPSEIAYLEGRTLGRLATIGADGQPHVVPVAYRYNAAEDAIDIGGIDFAATKKWRDVKANPRATFLVDDAVPGEAHAIEIRGIAEAHETGGDAINPRFPTFRPEFVRLRPRFVVSWWIERPGFDPIGRRVA